MSPTTLALGFAFWCFLAWLRGFVCCSGTVAGRTRDMLKKFGASSAAITGEAWT